MPFKKNSALLRRRPPLRRGDRKSAGGHFELGEVLEQQVDLQGLRWPGLVPEHCRLVEQREQHGPA